MYVRDTALRLGMGLLKRSHLDEPWQLIPRAVTHEEARAIKARVGRI